MTVFDAIVGQDKAIETLKKATAAAANQLASQEMTHAWLFIGPPGSGRSNLAIAFATSITCTKGGCGVCTDCQTALLGNHPDIEIFATEGISVKVDEIRELVSRASWGASIAPWRVVVIEDCDRMTESAANALLKAIEEPGTQTVWILCAPSVDEVLPTIRSRCRLLSLQTPTTKDITEYLESNLKINPETAKLSALAAQGHIGRAKYFATDACALQVRSKVLKLFTSISSEHQAIQVAAELVEMAITRSEVRNQEFDQKEEENLRLTIQRPSRGFLQGGSKALKELEKTQKNRNTRTIRDEIDSYLIYLQSFLRDAILYNKNSTQPLINADMAKEIESIQANSVPAKLEELALRINHYRFGLDSNASQLLTLESLGLDFLASTRGR